MKEKFERYTRALSIQGAVENTFERNAWRELEEMRDYYSNEVIVGNEYRVTVERIEPEAEPEKKWWYCNWSPMFGLRLTKSQTGSTNGPSTTVRFRGEEISSAVAIFSSATEPTLAEFAAAVKDATGVEVPMPEEEEPQWWWWNGEEWRGDDSCPRYAHTGINMFGRLVCTVYGTTEDRDAKRDALLEAARKAGAK